MNLNLLRNICLVILAFLAISADLIAQGKHLMGVEAGIHTTGIRDQSMSPLIYSGFGISGAVCFSTEKDGKTASFFLNLKQGSLVSKGGNYISGLAAGFRNFTLYSSKLLSGNRLKIGWSNNNHLSVYDHESYGNFSSRFYYFTSFGPAVRLHHTFNLPEQRFSAGILADMQLIGFTLRPSYVDNAPEGYLDPENGNAEAFFESIELFFPGSAWDIAVNPSVRFRMKSGNFLELGYYFTYTRVNKPEPVTETGGRWHLSLITLL